ncbi:hypothetical protein [Spirochaeta cellobiosiphila]|uniref:hypothetical protein n=1 Tax=Spirochaeta cellobiosiphila TaxID=504483 RepID=UPI00048EDAE0|nr:hypothetical protein [Spirochaeta cellobiosiphila]
MNFDHVVIHANDTSQVYGLKEILVDAGIPYEPSWGKKSKGFQISNIWIGNQYFEIVDILHSENQWQPNWAKRHADGDRGSYCIFLKTTLPVDEVYQRLKAAGFSISEPERTSFKWFFKLFQKKLPWRFSLTSKIPGTEIELGFIEYDKGAESKFAPFMVPNSSENGINSISQAKVLSTKLDLARAWLGKAQEALGEPISLSVGEKTEDVALLLEVEVTEDVEFSAVSVFDVLLQPKSVNKPF